MADSSPVGAKGASILRTRRLLSSRRIALNATAVCSVMRNRSHRSAMEKGVSLIFYRRDAYNARRLRTEQGHQKRFFKRVSAVVEAMLLGIKASPERQTPVKHYIPF